MSPNISLKEEVKFQSYILSSLFFHLKAIYGDPYKDRNESTESHWRFLIKITLFIIFNFSIRRKTIFSKMDITFFNDTSNVIFQCTFLGDIIFTFLAEG